MRVVIQRVSEAQVIVNNKMHGQIKQGLVVLLGIMPEDTQEDINWICNKLINLRIFSDKDGLMNLNLQQVNGDVLLVSQFTLYASTKKGNRPSFIKSAKPEQAIQLYNACIKQLEQLLLKPIATGQFGANMQLSLCNDGPVTICIDSKHKE